MQGSGARWGDFEESGDVKWMIDRNLIGLGAGDFGAGCLRDRNAVCSRLKAGRGYGFSEQRIEDDRYRITFRGNSSTSRETVENSLLYRAAELTVQTGL